VAHVAFKRAAAAPTRAVALDHVAANIRADAVAPGTTWSSCFDRILSDSDRFVAA